MYAMFLIIHSEHMGFFSSFLLKEKLWKISLWIHLLSQAALQTYSDFKLEELPDQESRLQGLPWPAEKLLLNIPTSSYLIEQRDFFPHPHLLYGLKSILLPSHHDLQPIQLRIQVIFIRCNRYFIRQSIKYLISFHTTTWFLKHSMYCKNRISGISAFWSDRW